MADKTEVFAASYADRFASISAFKRNPGKIMEDAGEDTVLVLNHNEPAFYCLSAEIFESLMDRLEDAVLGEMAQERLDSGDETVVVDIDDL